MIYVTHNQVEAMTMGDRICVMRDGNIVQVADPLTLYRKSDNLFVAGFIASPPMNLLKGKIEQCPEGLAFTETSDKAGLTIPLKGPVTKLASRYVGKNVVFGVRPEHITEGSLSACVPVQSTVDIAEPMGSESLVYFKAGTGNLIARIHGEHLFHMGQPLTAQINMEKCTSKPSPKRRFAKNQQKALGEGGEESRSARLFQSTLG